MKTNEKMAIWFLITTLLCVFVLTMLLLIQDIDRIFYLAAVLLLLLQIIGLSYSLRGEIKTKHPFFGRLFKLNFWVSFSVVVFAAASYLVMSAQFHRPIRADAEGNIASLDMEAVRGAENSYVFHTDSDLYVIFPAYTSVEYVFDRRPTMDDPDVTFFCASAFYERHELGFSHDNVTGDHAHRGIYYEGTKVPDLGAFTFYNGAQHFALEEPERAIRLAAENGGDGFEQFILIFNRQIVYRKLRKLRCYRALAELNGRLCIVESAVPLRFDDYIQRVLDLGVTNAVYLDMGGKSTFSQYRNNEGEAVNLFGGIPMPFIHSWLVFRK